MRLFGLAQRTRSLVRAGARLDKRQDRGDGVAHLGRRFGQRLAEHPLASDVLARHGAEHRLVGVAHRRADSARGDVRGVEGDSLLDVGALRAVGIGPVIDQAITAQPERMRGGGIRGEKVTILSDNDRVPPDYAHPDEINIVGKVSHIVRRI
jgi:hypothetical protein